MSSELSFADVAAAQAGDRDAFGRIVDATRNAVCSIAYVVLRNVEQSEDCAQDVYLSAWQGLPKLKDPASFLPWLRQITRYRAADLARKGAHDRHKRVRGEHAEAVIGAYPDSARGPAEQLLDAEQLALLDEAMASLETECREILILYYREEQSTKAVSELLNLSEAAIRKRLSRARQALRASALDQLAAYARQTAPTGAFTAAVLTGLTVAAPSTAAAAVSIAVAKGAAPGAGKLLLGLSGVLIGPLIGIGGILYGARREWRNATDQGERDAIRRVALLNILFTTIAVFAMVCHQYWRSNILIVAPYLGMVAGLYWTCMVILVRAKQPRYAREVAAEGEVAIARHRREARWRWIGMGTGVILGGATIIVALIYRGS
jgi:RNA polymerase sigma factor (sigma-70 family)